MTSLVYERENCIDEASEFPEMRASSNLDLRRHYDEQGEWKNILKVPQFQENITGFRWDFIVLKRGHVLVVQVPREPERKENGYEDELKLC